jgi:hypothetical protein
MQAAFHASIARECRYGVCDVSVEPKNWARRNKYTMLSSIGSPAHPVSWEDPNGTSASAVLTTACLFDHGRRYEGCPTDPAL